MALHLHDATSRVYFTLTCDDCHQQFACYDDACYSVDALRNEAVFAGWDAPVRPDLTHHCPTCLARRTSGSALRGQPTTR
jgi:hypothetical protein